MRFHFDQKCCCESVTAPAVVLLLFFFEAHRLLPVKCLHPAFLLTSLCRLCLPIFLHLSAALATVVAQIKHGVCHRGAA